MWRAPALFFTAASASARTAADYPKRPVRALEIAFGLFLLAASLRFLPSLVW